MREAKVEEFMNLKQGSMTVKGYCIKFNQLAKYAPDLITDPRASMSKFMTGVSGLVLKEYRIAMLNRNMDLARLMMHPQQIEMDKSKERERSNKRFRICSYNFFLAGSQGGNCSHYSLKNSTPVPYSASVLTPNFGDVCYGGAPGSKAQISVRSERTYPVCGECGKNHLGACRAKVRYVLGAVCQATD